MEFSARDLLWTKNVTRDKGSAWAYDEYQTGDTFYLNFPLGNNRMGMASAGKAKANELILLVQSIYNRKLGIPGTYLSHIVAPVDGDVVLEGQGSHPVKRLVTVVARNDKMIPKPPFLDFFQPNRGWTCNIDLVKPLKGSGLSFTLEEKRDLLWGLFSSPDTGIKGIIAKNMALPVEDSPKSPEGEEKYRMIRHKYYERDPKLILAKKTAALALGPLRCEACGFEFGVDYGLHGEGFMECHHRFPIAKSGKRLNGPEDLALVCANCHRMLHRKNVDGEYYLVEELRDLLGEIRKERGK